MISTELLDHIVACQEAWDSANHNGKGTTITREWGCYFMLENKLHIYRNSYT